MGKSRISWSPVQIMLPAKCRLKLRKRFTAREPREPAIGFPAIRSAWITSISSPPRPLRRKGKPAMSKLLPVLLLSLVLLSSCSAKPETEIIEPTELPMFEVTTPEPTPTVPLWSEEEVDVLAKMVWGEARGVPSDTEKAACVCGVRSTVSIRDMVQSLR